MNLRKFTARTIAVASCAAMLSTNVFAATRSITPSADNGKLKVTIGGDAGQTTFLAVDAGTALASVSGDKIQYIEQDSKTAESDLIYTFGQRTGGADKVDLYSGGEGVESYASKTGVAVKAIAAVKESEVAYTAAAENDFMTKYGTADTVKAFLANKRVKVDYTAIGSVTADEVEYTADNADDFTFGAPTADTAKEIYTVTVKYKNIDAGSITVKETDPKAAVSIAVTGGEGKTFYYNNAESEFTAEIAKALLSYAITVTATYDDNTTGTISDDDVTYEVSGGTVTIKYGDLIADTTITVNLVKRVITGVTINNINMKTATMTARSAEDVTEEDVENFVKNLDADRYVTYKWNDNTESYDDLSDLNVAAEKDTSDESGKTWKATLTSDRYTLPTDAVIIVTIEERTALGIKGKVTVADTWGITSGTTFKNAIPVGAVVTAIPKLTAKGYSGNVANTSFSYTSYAAMVDKDGNYELELPEGTYNVYVSHTRYVVRNVTATNITVSTFRTLLDGQAKFEVTISDSDTDLQTHNADLRYAYAGDMNLDGKIDVDTDYTQFAAKFGVVAVPEISTIND